MIAKAIIFVGTLLALVSHNQIASGQECRFRASPSARWVGHVRRPICYRPRLLRPGKQCCVSSAPVITACNQTTQSSQQAVHQQSIEGTVTLDGKPLESGVVIQFTPVDGSGPGAETMIENGKFIIDSGSNGKFKIDLKSK